ncbi:hypothetical protein FACS1894132_07910 [Clostridia bacterium]|nr:hypothetical protein FACS1894132_07910 [Clostridia bacterium]
MIFWIPGGYSTGGLPEAVIDAVPPAPFTGNGFTALTNKSLIPEYHVEGVGQDAAHVTHGSTIYAVTPSGQKTAVATFIDGAFEKTERGLKLKGLIIIRMEFLNI